MNNKFNKFNKGGSHESNKYGGIPMNKSSNGKMNTVEQDETSFDFDDGKYIFSDRLSFDIKANRAQSSNDITQFDEGGLIDPPIKSTGPGDGISKPKEPKGIFPPQGGYTQNPFKGWGGNDNDYMNDINYPIDFIKKNHRTSTTGPEHPLLDRRDAFMAHPAGKESYVDFDKAIKNESSRQFLNRYNDPITRQRLKDQAGIDDAQIDNMILQGLHPSLVEGDLGPKANGLFMLDNPNEVFVNPDAPDAQATETHERLHSSNIDSLMGVKLQDVMGSTFKQGKSRALRSQSPDFLEYMNKPHESYSNFADFRESLGLKPGEQIDEKELEKRVKTNKLEEKNFYKTYDNKKIIKALNTIADNSKSNTKYKGLT